MVRVAPNDPRWYRGWGVPVSQVAPAASPPAVIAKVPPGQFVPNDMSGARRPQRPIPGIPLTTTNIDILRPDLAPSPGATGAT